MLTSERREKKQGKIRNSEYYGMESIFDTLYAESRNGKTFNHLMAIIESEENIKLALKIFSCSSYEVCKLYCKPCATEFDGTPCAVKAARTVWSRGKAGDHIKCLPMAIWC